LGELDHLVAERKFKNRSQAIQSAVKATIERLSHHRLAEECAKLDPDFERKLADEGLEGDASEWPKF
jgi:Arc/MetJ-type ribon-helix-helix transcriptional regulator